MRPVPAPVLHSRVPLLPLLQLLFDDSIWNLLPTVDNEVRL